MADATLAPGRDDGSDERSGVSGMRLEGIAKTYEGGVQAVKDLSLTLEQGALLTLVGPSGCGKTTTLRCVAGLETPDRGRIHIADSVVFDSTARRNVAPEHRNLGMVFQSYAVWPHMRVFDNVAYPLTVGGRHKRGDIRPRVEEMLRLVGLEGMGPRYATNLSGGQQQRVALARALVANPRVVLFDEPLSNLDVALRKEMRVVISEIHRRVGMSAIYVTHDQEEALALSDQIAVMNHGVAEQVGPADEVFFNPQTEFVASFLGGGALCRGRVVETPDRRRIVVRLDGPEPLHVRCRPVRPFGVGDAVSVAVRPEGVTVLPTPPAEPGENVFVSDVDVLQFLGYTSEVHTQIGSWKILVRDAKARNLSPGDRCGFQVDDDLAIAVPAGDQNGVPQQEADKAAADSPERG